MQWDESERKYICKDKCGNVDYEWDGSADTSWYDANKTEFTFSTAEQIAGLASLVDGGTNFAGKTITLEDDLYLGGTQFNCIGTNAKPFKGTFDGDGHTIYDLTVTKDNGAYYGLFGGANGATIKDFNVDGATLSPSNGKTIGTIVGHATNCTLENITISNGSITNANNMVGGVIGEAYGTTTLTNCDVAASTVLHERSNTTALGGLIGYCENDIVKLKDCDVACVIDAYSDAINANYVVYGYRYCGMLIGYTNTSGGSTAKEFPIASMPYATAPKLTAENCTVTYSEWAMYTYCEDSSCDAGVPWPYCINGTRVNAEAFPSGLAEDPDNTYWGFVRTQPGIVQAGLAPHSQDVHDACDSCHLYIPFDQLYGAGHGGGRNSIRGQRAHEGVTVIFPKGYKHIYNLNLDSAYYFIPFPLSTPTKVRSPPSGITRRLPLSVTAASWMPTTRPSASPTM